MTISTSHLILATISLLLFAFSTYIGFVPLDKHNYNEKQWENRLKKWTNKVFKKLKWEWPIKERFALTKIGLIIATVCGLLGVWLPY